MAHDIPLKAIIIVPPTCVSARTVENMRKAKDMCASVQIWDMLTFHRDCQTLVRLEELLLDLLGRTMNWKKILARKAVIAAKNVANVPTRVAVCRIVFEMTWCGAAL
jgi:hypothetical protein